jgi:DNA-binding response OmpR family regulator
VTTIVIVSSDLLLQSRVAEVARRAGYETALADTTDELAAALDGAVALVTLDLHVVGLDWRAAAALAHERSVPVLAYGRHTEAALLREARDAGCERVVPRSALVEDLPGLIATLAKPAGILPPE